MIPGLFGAAPAIAHAIGDDEITREERALFPSVSEYAVARGLIMDRWRAKPTEFLTLESCFSTLSDGGNNVTRALVSSAYTFLATHGLINFGVSRPPHHGESGCCSHADMTACHRHVHSS